MTIHFHRLRVEGWPHADGKHWRYTVACDHCDMFLVCRTWDRAMDDALAHSRVSARVTRL